MENKMKKYEFTGETITIGERTAQIAPQERSYSE